MEGRLSHSVSLNRFYFSCIKVQLGCMKVKFLLDVMKAVVCCLLFIFLLGRNFEDEKSERPFKGYERYSAVS